MTSVNVRVINKALKGFDQLVQFDLLVSAEKSFGLTLTLANFAGAKTVLVCRDVQNLELNPAGTGFQQMLRLEVTDVRKDGLDRIHFTVEEMEHETLFLHCATIELQDLPA